MLFKQGESMELRGFRTCRTYTGQLGRESCREYLEKTLQASVVSTLSFKLCAYKLLRAAVYGLAMS